jgi:hypothetical protein
MDKAFFEPVQADQIARMLNMYAMQGRRIQVQVLQTNNNKIVSRPPERHIV